MENLETSPNNPNQLIGPWSNYDERRPGETSNNELATRLEEAERVAGELKGENERLREEVKTLEAEKRALIESINRLASTMLERVEEILAEEIRKITAGLSIATEEETGGGSLDHEPPQGTQQPTAEAPSQDQQPQPGEGSDQPKPKGKFEAFKEFLRTSGDVGALPTSGGDWYREFVEADTGVEIPTEPTPTPTPTPNPNPNPAPTPGLAPSQEQASAVSTADQQPTPNPNDNPTGTETEAEADPEAEAGAGEITDESIQDFKNQLLAEEGDKITFIHLNDDIIRTILGDKDQIEEVDKEDFDRRYGKLKGTSSVAGLKDFFEKHEDQGYILRYGLEQGWLD